MKKVYILFVLAALSFSSNAQNFVFTTEQHIVDTITTAFSSNYIGFTTPDPEEITFQFEKISNTIPIQWDFSLCDYTNCYVGVPDVGTMTTISLTASKNGTQGFFTLTGTHGGVAGEGILELYVYDSNDYTRGDTVSWHLVYDPTVSIAESDAINAFRISPNPTRNMVKIDWEGNFIGAIFNGLGERVQSIEGNQSETIDVSNLGKGVYIITCQNESGNTYSSQLIIQ